MIFVEINVSTIENGKTRQFYAHNKSSLIYFSREILLIIKSPGERNG